MKHVPRQSAEAAVEAGAVVTEADGAAMAEAAVGVAAAMVAVAGAAEIAATVAIAGRQAVRI